LLKWPGREKQTVDSAEDGWEVVLPAVKLKAS
jgi:hypothetical protein